MTALKPRILVFGNPALPDDSLAFRVGRKLQALPYRFIECDAVDCLLKHPEYAYILDVAKGIGRVRVIDDPKALVSHPLMSLHDFDLSFFLRLLDAIGPERRCRIIAIPIGYPLDKAVAEVKAILEKKD